MNTKQLQFILARAACLLVEACTEYRAILPLDGRIGLDAPSTFEGLKADAAQEFLKVSTEHNTSSTFHDFGHLLFNKAFTLVDEVELSRIQWQDLKGYLPAEWVDVCHCVYVYVADTEQQSLYEAETGNFPADQKRFVLGFLADHFA